MGQLNKKRKNPRNVITAVFTSASRQFLASLHCMLRKKGIRHGYVWIPKPGTFGRLVFSVNDSLKLYEIMYNGPHGLFLERKKLVFERFIKMRL